MDSGAVPIDAGQVFISNGYVLDESPQRLGELEAIPDSIRSDRDALWERFRAEGYLYLRQALDAGDVVSFRRYYFERLAAAGLIKVGSDPELGIVADAPPDNEILRRVLFREIVPGRRYLDFCEQPAIRGWYEWFLAGSPHLHRRKLIRHIYPGERGVGTATQAHYDLVYLRGGTDQVLTSWIPLGACPPERGALIYLERSHLAVRAEERAGGIRPTGWITADLPDLARRYDTRWLVADYQPGDMVIHSAFTIHAALDNVDPDGVMRLSTDIRYQRADEPIDEGWRNHWHPDDRR